MVETSKKMLQAKLWDTMRDIQEHHPNPRNQLKQSSIYDSIRQVHMDVCEKPNPASTKPRRLREYSEYLRSYNGRGEILPYP